MLELVTPDVRFREAWLASHHEWGPGVHEDGFGIRAGDEVDDPAQFGAWVDRLRDRPGSLWWIVDGDDVLGGIVLRPTAEDVEGRVTGHVGYGVRPSARGRGVASWALREVLVRAAEAGMPGCVLVCRDHNVASIRTIERAGGSLTGVVDDGDGRARHYWIPTPDVRCGIRA